MKKRDVAEQKKKINTAYLYFKYTVETILSFLALIVCLPLFAVIAIAIKIEDGGKVMFTQERRGRHGKIFKCYKFRSMKSTHIPFDPKRAIIRDDNENLTKVGKVIRKFHLDELPQLFNILRGDMCIIGFRPLLAHYFVYENWELIKFEMRPGLTGLEQVMGNSHLSNRARNYYDAYYVTHVSFLMDLKIFFKTIAVLVAGERRFLKIVPQKDYYALKTDIIENYHISEETVASFDEGELIPDKEILSEVAADEYINSATHE